MSDNRLEALAAFLAANPDLPEGTDTPAPAPKAAPRARLTVSMERKGRGGKTATIIAGNTSRLRLRGRCLRSCRRPQEAHGHGRLGARLRSAAARRLPRQGT